MQDTGSDLQPQWTEAERLAALRAYDILDTGPDGNFDALVALAARICDTPMALVSLVDDERQWFKSRVGPLPAQTSRDVSFCDHAMRGDRLMIVTDALSDPRFAENRLVTGEPHIRFYAGAPLRTPEGIPLGSLCVLDTVPRPAGLSELQIQTLTVLADQVMTQLELRRALRDKRESRQSADRAMKAADYVGAWDWDILEDRIVADSHFAAMFGVDVERARVGVPLSDFIAGIHPDDADRVASEIETAMVSLGVFESEYRLVNGRDLRWVLVRGQVYGDVSGAPVRFPGVAIDITARKRVEQELASTVDALAESEAKFRAIADSMPQMVWSTRPDGFHDYYNARWYEFTGVPAGSTDGEGWNDMFHPDEQAEAWKRWSHSLATGDPYEIEYRLKHNSGTYRWTLGRAMPIRNEAGQITRWFGTCTDIDDLKKMEASRELLSQELSHRIKNIFAVISALIALSAREYPEARPFATAVRNRIGALARAHEFVRPHSDVSRPTVGSMTLHAFLEALFQPYADDHGVARVILSGDDAVFDDQAATSVALLFHELATNAAKYGALSAVDGRVLLETRRTDDRFILTWTERGGPTVSGSPTHSGFGSSLATVSVEGQLGGRLERSWQPEGLVVTADLPATALSRRRAALKLA